MRFSTCIQFQLAALLASNRHALNGFLKSVCCEHLLYYCYHFLATQVYSILNLVRFFVFLFFCRGNRVAGRFLKMRTKMRTKKTRKTRQKRLSFRNGLGTVPGVYEATTIAHRGHNGGRHLWGVQNFILA
jgi:hypothetical protein